MIRFIEIKTGKDYLIYLSFNEETKVNYLNKIVKTDVNFSLYEGATKTEINQKTKEEDILWELIGANYKSLETCKLRIEYDKIEGLNKEFETFEDYKQFKNSKIKGKNIKPNRLQEEVLEAIKNYRKTGKKSWLCIIPTGCGKTYLSVLETKEFSKEDLNKIKIVFISHLRNVIKQTHASFSNVFWEKNVWFYTSEYGKDIEKPIIIASAKSLSGDLNLFNKNHFDYLIVDEFHHAIANQFSSIMKYFDYKFLLWLTATPSRTDNQDVTKLVEGIIYETNLTDVLAKFPEILAYPDYHLINTNLNFSDEFENGSFNVAKISRKMIVPSLDELVLKEIKDKVKSKKTLIFCPSVLYAKHMTKLLNKHNLKTGFVWVEQENQMTPKKIMEEIEKFKSWEYQFLISVDMLNEGFDVPDCEALIFLRPTDSERIWLQQLGRGLRKKEGKETVLVLDFVWVANNFSNLENKVNVIKKLNNLFDIKINKKEKDILNIGTDVVKDNKEVNKIDESILDFLEIKKLERLKKIEDKEEKIQIEETKVKDITDTILELRSKLGRIGLYSLVPTQTKRDILYTLFYMKYKTKANLEMLNLDRLTLAFGIETRWFIMVLEDLLFNGLKEIQTNYKIIKGIEYVITYGSGKKEEDLRKEIKNILMEGKTDILEELIKNGEKPYIKFRELAFWEGGKVKKEDITKKIRELWMSRETIKNSSNLLEKYELNSLEENDVSILYWISKEKLDEGKKYLTDKHFKCCFLLNKNLFVRKIAYENIKDLKFKEEINKDKNYKSIIEMFNKLK